MIHTKIPMSLIDSPKLYGIQSETRKTKMIATYEFKHV